MLTVHDELDLSGGYVQVAITDPQGVRRPFLPINRSRFGQFKGQQLAIFFLVLEMVLWDKPAGRRILGLDPDFANRTRRLAANQGLYNGFLAAGLIWSLLADQHTFDLRVFFLGCVIIAGIFGHGGL